MHDLKVMPAEPSADMLGNAMSVCTGFSGDYGTYNCYLSEDAAREVYQAFRAAAPAVQGEPLGYVVPRMAARLGKGELCGISVLDQPAPDVAGLVEALNAARDKLETVESRGHGERWTAREMWPGLFAQIDAALVGRSE